MGAPLPPSLPIVLYANRSSALINSREDHYHLPGRGRHLWRASTTDRSKTSPISNPTFVFSWGGTAIDGEARSRLITTDVRWQASTAQGQ